MIKDCKGCNNVFFTDRTKNNNPGSYCSPKCSKYNSIKRLTTRSNYVSKNRAIKKKLDFNLTPKYLEFIFPKDWVCKILKIKMKRIPNGSGKGSQQKNNPELNRIHPQLGYIKGNVEYISSIANRMLSDATDEELIKFKDYLNERFK